MVTVICLTEKPNEMRKCFYFQIGIYVVMFLEILQTLIRVLLVFSILIIAFGLSFYIVLSKSKVCPNRINFSLIKAFHNNRMIFKTLQ